METINLTDGSIQRKKIEHQYWVNCGTIIYCAEAKGKGNKLALYRTNMKSNEEQFGLFTLNN